MNLRIDWFCRSTWKTASYNTTWCLIGCSIGDFGTIAYFQFMEINWSVWAIMCLAILNGLITSIALETIILVKQMNLRLAFKTAIGMSLISMISMEAIVPKSPMLHPSKHHDVLIEATFHVCLHIQFIFKIINYLPY